MNSIRDKIGRYSSEKSRFTIKFNNFADTCRYLPILQQWNCDNNPSSHYFIGNYHKLIGCELIVSHNWQDHSNSQNGCTARSYTHLVQVEQQISRPSVTIEKFSARNSTLRYVNLKIVWRIEDAYEDERIRPRRHLHRQSVRKRTSSFAIDHCERAQNFACHF